MSEPVAQTVNSMLLAFDELMVRAAQFDPEVADEAIGIGQIMMRCQLILSFLEARKASKLKVVCHG